MQLVPLKVKSRPRTRKLTGKYQEDQTSIKQVHIWNMKWILLPMGDNSGRSLFNQHRALDFGIPAGARKSCILEASIISARQASQTPARV